MGRETTELLNKAFALTVAERADLAGSFLSPSLWPDTV
jgi:hypothetical protein